MKYCKNCNAEYSDSTNFCPNCGKQLIELESTEKLNTMSAQNQTYISDNSHNNCVDKDSTGLVLGILSICLGITTGLIGLICGIIGLITSKTSQAKKLNIIGTLISSIIIIGEIIIISIAFMYTYSM